MKKKISSSSNAYFAAIVTNALSVLFFGMVLCQTGDVFLQFVAFAFLVLAIFVIGLCLDASREEALEAKPHPKKSRYVMLRYRRFVHSHYLRQLNDFFAHQRYPGYPSMLC